MTGPGAAAMFDSTHIQLGNGSGMNYVQRRRKAREWRGRNFNGGHAGPLSESVVNTRTNVNASKEDPLTPKPLAHCACNDEKERLGKSTAGITSTNSQG